MGYPSFSVREDAFAARGTWVKTKRSRVGLLFGVKKWVWRLGGHHSGYFGWDLTKSMLALTCGTLSFQSFSCSMEMWPSNF